MYFYKRFIILVFSFGLFVYGAFPAQAQQVDLMVSPPSIELLIKPGVNLRVPFTVTNQSDKISVRPLIETFTVSENGKTITYGRADSKAVETTFLDQNLKPISSFSLSKGEEKKVYVRFSVAPTAAEKDYNLAFILETQPEFLDKQYSMRIKTRVAAPMLVTVTQSGTTQVNGVIDRFEVVGRTIPFLFKNVPVFDSFDQIPVVVHVINKGTNVVYAGGVVTIRGSFGEKAEYRLYNHNILAGSGRTMNSVRSKDNYTTILQGFFIGKYKASTTVSLAEGTVQLSSSSGFYAFPFKILLCALLSVIMGLILLKKKR